MTHPILNFLTDDDIVALFDGVVKLNSFCRRLEQVAFDKYPTDVDDRNAFKGDIFELFTEFLIKYQGTNPAIAIRNYKPISETGKPDYGVDGVGESTLNGTPITVQVKYRQSDVHLTQNEGRLGNFFQHSYLDFFFPQNFFPKPRNDHNMLVVTTAADLHYSVDEINHKTMRCLNRQNLRQLVDKVEAFWSEFKEAVTSNRIPVSPVTDITLRVHQETAVTHILNDMQFDDGKGQIILPTGTGKTYIFAETIARCADRGQKTFLILSPRILLSFQLLQEVAKYLIRRGVKAEYLNVNSGRFDEAQITEERMRAGVDARRVKSTTSSTEIARIANELPEDRILIVSSTYHSADRLRESGIAIDTQLNDEAHNMVSEEFSKCHGIGRNEISFTATRITTSGLDGLGMQNEALWGNVIYEKTPCEMIAAGEVLPVRAHTVSLPDIGQRIADNDFNAITRCVSSSFDEHWKYLRKDSADDQQIAPKMLVALDGQATLRGILDCEQFGHLRTTSPNIKVFAISSDVGTYIDGEWQDTSSNSKDLLLRALRGLEDTTPAIIMHVNMLGEGIDVPGITGFMPLRGVGTTAFKQSLGRAMRLAIPDKLRFYAGDIPAAESDDGHYLKPRAYVVIPNITIGQQDNAAQQLRTWASLFDEFGRPEQLLLTQYRGLPTDEPLEGQNELDHNLPVANSGVSDFIHQTINRPDQRDIDDIWFMKFLDSMSWESSMQVFKKLGMVGQAEDLRTLASWHKASGRDPQDIGQSSSKIIQMSRSAGQGSFSDEVKKKFGTIYTPDFVVEKTTDLALKYITDGADLLKLEYCDPAAGDGNFLAYLYKRLMLCDSIADPIERSHYILTKCLWGIEILEPMVRATKVRLLLLHLETVREYDGDLAACAGIVDELHVYHGNAILTPEDNFEFISKSEGGLLPEFIRNKKFDVIVGNPPYTHLRNLENRRYAAYPKQRDMAQIFVRWSLDHLKKDGVCSLNTSETWLDVKTTDGALETRRACDRRLLAICADAETAHYSEEHGGNVITMIVVLAGAAGAQHYHLNEQSIEYTTEQLVQPRFFPIKPPPYQWCEIRRLGTVGTMDTGRKSNRIENEWLRAASYHELDDSEDQYHIVAPFFLGSRARGTKFKLIRGSKQHIIVSGRWRFIAVNEKMQALFIFGCLNSSICINQLLKLMRTSSTSGVDRTKGEWITNLDSRKLAIFPAPDYDYYTEHHPERTKAYLTWVETNMRDKDAFLAGVDEEFDRLIGLDELVEMADEAPQSDTLRQEELHSTVE